MDPLAEMFMKYDYAEAKDLCKQFLTTVVAVLVFSLTFAEKIISFSTATRLARLLLLGGWCSFMLAIIGVGLAYITVAAGSIIYGQRRDYEHVATGNDVMDSSSWCILCPRIAFIVRYRCSFRLEDMMFDSSRFATDRIPGATRGADQSFSWSCVPMAHLLTRRRQQLFYRAEHNIKMSGAVIFW